MTKPADTYRKQTKAESARQDILLAAAQMMRRSGYSEMSLRDLAARVGMKAGSLYYHFPSKEALATEVMTIGVGVVQDAVRKRLEEHPGAKARARLIMAMHVHLETLLSESDFSSAHIRCYPFVPEAVRLELSEVRRAYGKDWTDLISAYLEAAPDHPDVRHMRHAILGALNWSLEWFDPKRDDVDAYLASLESLIPDEAVKKS